MSENASTPVSVIMRTTHVIDGLLKLADSVGGDRESHNGYDAATDA